MSPVIIILVGIVCVLLGIIVFRLHAVLALLVAALVTGILTSADLIYDFALHKGFSPEDAEAFSVKTIGERLTVAFGNTAGKIGILIALASVIGTALMRSGGAERIIRSLLNLFGKKNISLAFLTGSFTLAIPVFFDTVFYLMIPLVKSISVRNPKKFSLYLMAVVGAGVMAHSLIPPTPGPLFVAQEMGIDLGAMIIGGLAIGSITTICGYLYARWANKKWDLPLRETPDISIDELKQYSEKKENDLPPLWISILPVILPLFLIAGNTLLNMFFKYDATSETPFTNQLRTIFSIIGDSKIALFISAFIALYLLWSRLKNIEQFKKFLNEALLSSGMIILITSAGGTFGQMLQQTSIGISIQNMASDYQMAILPMAFFITALVRTAQGSATVAMITAIGVMSGFGAAELGFHPVYLALTIGCGSKIFPWMNDSAFWIVSRMSGMDEKETIRHFSFLLSVMGFSGLIAILILSTIFPFI